MFRGHSSSLWCYLNTFRITAKCHHDVLFDVRLMLQFCIIDISRIFICTYSKKSFFVIHYEQYVDKMRYDVFVIVLFTIY